MGSLVDLAPEAFAEQLHAVGRRRLWLVRDPVSGSLRASSPEFDELAAELASGARDFAEHEAIFLGVGAASRALFGAFLHKTIRGQAQGGLRRWRYPTLGAFLRDGLRLSLGMGRKSALAGLWWGGGKGVIARPEYEPENDPLYRRSVYAEYGRFVTSLRGCYVTAEDAGTTPQDMAEVYHHTRFVTCVPRKVGGSGNPSAMTAAGVVAAMEGALAFAGHAGLAGKSIAMQGGGNVGSFMIERLLDKGVAQIWASDISKSRCQRLADRFRCERVHVEQVDAEDVGILARPCDILVPNALGGVLGPETIPHIAAPLVCGAANNQLVDDERDARALVERGILYVPDYVANRMGIVACSNEHAGSVSKDPMIEQHLDPANEGSVHQVTRRVLERARDEKTTPVAAANRLADEAALVPHPIWGHRARQIIDSLVEERWDRS